MSSNADPLGIEILCLEKFKLAANGSTGR